MPRTFWVGILCAAALGVGASAQVQRRSAPASAPVRPVTPPKDPYASEPFVLERLDTAYRYNADGTGTRTETRVIHVQNEAGVRNALVLSLPYAASSQRIEIAYLRVRKPNGTVVDTPPSDANDSAAPVTQIAPLYPDLHVLQVGVRGLAVGDRVESQIRTVTTHAQAGGQFWGTESFGESFVVLDRQVELRVPASRNVQVNSPKSAPVMTEEGGDKIFRWKGAQLTPSPKPKGPGQTVADQDEDGPDRDRAPDIAWTTFHSWAEVGDWYRGLAGSSAAPTPALKAKADQAVYGQNTPEAKIRALYEYVSHEVRTIDVSLSPDQYAPHSASEVLEGLYGNSNDKNAVFCALLRAEGLTASTVLVGVGPEVEEAVPAPGWFNHAITLAGDGAHRDFWLDTTPEGAPFGMLHSVLRDRLALVIPATGEARLLRTPADLPFPAFNRFEAKGTLSADGALQAHIDLTMRGDEELRYRAGLQDAGPTQWDRVTDFYLRSTGIQGTGSNTTADKVADLTTPLQVSFDLQQAPYGDWDNYRILPLQPGLNLPLTGRKAAPDHDVKFGGKRTDTATSRITLPPGYGADLPEPLHLHTSFANLDKTYRVEKSGDAQVLVTERTLAITADRLPPSQWSAYRKFLDDIGDVEPWVQLTSAKRGSGHGPPPTGFDNPAAAQLVEKADAAIEKKNYDDATASLDKAKALNPRQALLWSSYGVIAQRTGKLDAAVDDFRKELKEHPEEGFVSQMLATSLATQHKNDEAAAALRAALALNPQDVRSAVLLGRVLALTNNGAAERALRDGMAASPDNLELKLELGTLLVKEGKRDEGARLLVAVANGSQDPRQLNDAAYALGEASVNLGVAESASRRSVQLLNAASAQPQAGVADLPALRRTAQLVSGWDTYGWILFREGNVSEAEPWLRAAWADSYGVEAGKHYGALLQKEGRSAEAAQVLRLAAEGERSDAEIERSESFAVTADRNSRGATNARGLAAEHTFALPGLTNAPAGTALFEFDYALNFQPQVRFVSGDDGLSNLGAALRKVDTRTAIPPGSPAHVLRRGVVRCSASGNCTLEMLSTRAALAE